MNNFSKINRAYTAKKKFFLFAALVAAMIVNAEQIYWTEPIAKGNFDGKSFSDGDVELFITDQAGKFEVDANNCWFGDAENQTKFTHRLKTGGKSQEKEDANSALLLTVPSAGKVLICARTGSNSATDRNIVLTQNEVELFNHILLESEAIKVKGLDSKEPDKETNVYPVLEIEVAEGDIDIAYPVGSINIYSIEFKAAQALDNVNASVKAEKFFRDGQLIIRKNGMEYNALGVQL